VRDFRVSGRVDAFRVPQNLEEAWQEKKVLDTKCFPFVDMAQFICRNRKLEDKNKKALKQHQRALQTHHHHHSATMEKSNSR
jgi:hypothetical protein